MKGRRDDGSGTFSPRRIPFHSLLRAAFSSLLINCCLDSPPRVTLSLWFYHHLICLFWMVFSSVLAHHLPWLVPLPKAEDTGIHPPTHAGLVVTAFSAASSIQLSSYSLYSKAFICFQAAATPEAEAFPEVTEVVPFSLSAVPRFRASATKWKRLFLLSFHPSMCYFATQL